MRTRTRSGAKWTCPVDVQVVLRAVDEDRHTMRTVVHEPRVVAGIALMFIATVLGGLLLQGASQRVSVWQVAHNVAEGTVLTSADVHMGSAAPGAERAYASVREEVVGRVLTRDIAAGELLPRAALGDGAPALHLVAVPIERMHLVPGVRRGVRVDVWWTPRPDGARIDPTRRIFAGALVEGIVESGVGGGASVILALPPTAVRDVLAATRTGSIDLSAREAGA